MRSGSAKPIALGGMMAALALVIMCLGGLVPFATYVCPVFCMILGSIVFRVCGQRIAWAWYGAVSVLSAFIAPDKEAAAIYIFLGYYPYIKMLFDRTLLGRLIKYIYFNCVIILAYGILICLLGLTSISDEFNGVGLAGVILTLLLGNLTFFLLDKLLLRIDAKWRKKNGR